MLAAALHGLVCERLPSAQRKVRGVVRVGVDVVDLVWEKAGEPGSGDLLVARGKGGDEFHESDGAGRGLIAQSSKAQMSSPKAPQLNMVVMLILASRTTPPI